MTEPETAVDLAVAIFAGKASRNDESILRLARLVIAEHEDAPAGGSDDLFDFDDELVLEMVATHHRPHEERNLGGAVRVVCAECYWPWPCQPRQGLLRWLRENGRNR